MSNEDIGALAQSDSKMFERNVAILAAQGQQVYIVTSNEEESLTGFLAGLDENWLQVCISTRTQFSLSLVNRQQIVSIASTGLRLEHMSPFEREEIERHTSHFQRLCKSRR